MKAFFLTGSAALLLASGAIVSPVMAGGKNRQFDVARAGGWTAALFGKGKRGGVRQCDY
ncbi:putative fimbrial-like adhesin exported protein [Escherichia coli]|uniref:Putative fimbrial-like adhesin exported protein n=1 Tax=Escherichia coli TaxID=562 RepID=A0A376L987_ECOLX|nr:putative fimbrial-like adhesin exported protein [Escherichia coli]